MCLTVQDINEQLPKEFVPMKAKKDIVVYKMLEYTIRKRRLPYLYKKIYCTPYMGYDVKFNLFGRCVMKTDRMTGEYFIVKNLPYKQQSRRQKIVWINGESISNVMRSNNIGINDKENLYILEGIHAYTKIRDTSISLREFHKAIIPKGSYYFVDEVNDEIVADKIIILKKVVK